MASKGEDLLLPDARLVPKGKRLQGILSVLGKLCICFGKPSFGHEIVGEAEVAGCVVYRMVTEGHQSSLRDTLTENGSTPFRYHSFHGPGDGWVNPQRLLDARAQIRHLEELFHRHLLVVGEIASNLLREPGQFLFVLQQEEGQSAQQTRSGLASANDEKGSEIPQLLNRQLLLVAHGKVEKVRSVRGGRKPTIKAFKTDAEKGIPLALSDGQEHRLENIAHDGEMVERSHHGGAFGKAGE